MMCIEFLSLKNSKSFTIFRFWFLFKKGFWITGFTFYIPVSFGYGLDDYTINVSYEPFFMNAIFNLITWFIPMVLNAIFALQVMYHLSNRQKKRAQLSRPSQTREQSVVGNETHDTKATKVSHIHKLKRKFSLSQFKIKPTTRFQIIIFSYCFYEII